ncbi:unnamed protein product, partial [Protopolystoma xenopodis]
LRAKQDKALQHTCAQTTTIQKDAAHIGDGPSPRALSQSSESSASSSTSDNSDLDSTESELSAQSEKAECEKDNDANIHEDIDESDYLEQSGLTFFGKPVPGYTGDSSRDPKNINMADLLQSLVENYGEHHNPCLFGCILP